METYGPLGGIGIPEILILLFIFGISNILPALGVFFVARRIKLDTWAMVVLPLVALFIPLGLTISLFAMAFMPAKQPDPAAPPVAPVPPVSSAG